MTHVGRENVVFGFTPLNSLASSLHRGWTTGRIRIENILFV